MTSKYKKGQLPYEFVAIPKEVLLSSEWQLLGPNAMRLAFDLMAQYTGKNNGRLNASWECLKKLEGWRSETTLIKVKRELLECSFAVQTRQGRAPNVSDWVGFTWWKLDWERSMDIEPRGFPYLNFMRLTAPRKTLPALQKLESLPPKRDSRPTDSVAMDVAQMVA